MAYVGARQHGGEAEERREMTGAREHGEVQFPEPCYDQGSAIMIERDRSSNDRRLDRSQGSVRRSIVA